MGRLKVSLNVHPVVLQRDLTHLDNCYGEDDDDNGGNGDEDDVCNDDVEDGVDFPQMDFNLLNQDVIKNHQHNFYQPTLHV